MANRLHYGFIWVGQRGGGQAAHPEVARVASAYQSNQGGSVHMRPGDPVKKVNDGTVAHAAAGEAIYGVISAILPFYNSTIAAMDYGFQLPGGTTYAAQEQESRVMIIPAAGQLFRVCTLTASFTTEATWIAKIGENADHLFTRDATNLWASPTLDTQAAGAGFGTGTAQWRLVDIDRSRLTDYSATGVSLIVTANEVQQAPFITAGV